MSTALDPPLGRIAVVTGGAGAIGSAIIGALRGTGHRTIVLDRHGDIACDLASEASTRAAAAKVLEQYGRCDVFVHCAAAFDQVTINDVDSATWRHVQAVNVESALWLLQAFTPGMAERHYGRIVFITSDTFWAPPLPVLLAYIASKGALLGIMRTPGRDPRRRRHRRVRGSTRPDRHPGFPDRQHRRAVRRHSRPPSAQAAAHTR